MGFLVLQIWFLHHFSISRGGLEPSAIDGLYRQSRPAVVLKMKGTHFSRVFAKNLSRVHRTELDYSSWLNSPD